MPKSKEYYTDSKNAKYFPGGNIKNTIEKVAHSLFAEKFSSGNLYVIDNDLDAKIFSKMDSSIKDWSKESANVWVSSFNKAVKVYCVLDRTTYIIYK